jgi:hypothetical protein
MIRNKIFVLAVLATIALFNVSCKKSNGGGFIASAVPGGNGKATLGFQIKCDNILHESGNYVAQVTGNVQYNDHPAGVKVHGDLDFIPYDIDNSLTSCETIAELIYDRLPPNSNFSGAIGTYSNQAGQTGTIYFSAAEGIPEVCPLGKGFFIKLEGDINYRNSGCLDGGNLTIF